ncbi:MAG: ABC transporter ATP-binding protein [Bacilli bacterium]
MKEIVLEAKNLSKIFTLNSKQMKEKKLQNKEFTAVNDLSFCLYKGEIYGLLGPNGAGKTTTLRMLATLLEPSKGEIIFANQKLVKDNNEIRKDIGFLTSEMKLDDFFTVEDTFNFYGEVYGMSKEEIEERKNVLFTKFQIKDFKTVRICNLSTGMKQKASLAISLINNPKLIIFDEPTNGLDIATTKMVEDYLLDLKKEGKTIILSTHIFSLVEKLCDRVGIIINGKKVLDESLEEIHKEGSLEDKFFQLYSYED